MFPNRHTLDRRLPSRFLNQSSTNGASMRGASGEPVSLQTLTSSLILSLSCRSTTNPSAEVDQHVTREDWDSSAAEQAEARLRFMDGEGESYLTPPLIAKLTHAPSTTACASGSPCTVPAEDRFSGHSNIPHAVNRRERHRSRQCASASRRRGAAGHARRR